MLTQIEQHEIETEFPKYADRTAVCIDALRIVQRHRGWISDEALRDVAALLEMSPAELDSVATFYNLVFREPVGRHVILMCDSVSCWVMGCDRVREALCDALGIQPGETTPDGRYTLLPMVCLGACDKAPVVMVDQDTHVNVDANQVRELIERYK